MTTLREADLALEALLKSHTCPLLPDDCEAAITALKAALAEPVQEPVAWVRLEAWKSGKDWPDDCFTALPAEGLTPLYTAPPPRYNRSPHDLTEFVNYLCEISNKFAGTTQLHDRIAVQVHAFLKQSSSGEHCGYPHCDGGSMGTYCHTHCEKKF